MVVKPEERQEIHLKGIKRAEVKLQFLVSDALNRRMEAYLVSLKTGAGVKGHFFSHKGDEFAYVMEGELEVELRGEKQRLKPGDSLYLETTVPSKWANVGKSDAILLWVLSPPRREW